MKDERAGGEPSDDEPAAGGEDGGVPALVATGLPIALQVARRVARSTRVLDRFELESVARNSVASLIVEYDPARGPWKSFVATRVGYALWLAVRRETRAKFIEPDVAFKAGLERAEALHPCVDPLAGDDEEAYERLLDVTSATADAIALHMSAGSEAMISLVREGISRLRDLERRVIELHYLEQKSFRAIAVILGTSVGRVFRAHERGLLALRRRLHGME